MERKSCRTRESACGSSFLWRMVKLSATPLRKFQNPNHMALAIHKIIEFFHEDGTAR